MRMTTGDSGTDPMRAMSEGPPPTAGDEAIRRRLTEHAAGGRRRWLKRGAIAGTLLLLVGGLAFGRASGDDDGPKYQSAAAERGELAVTVTATGRLEARETVDVGTEVSGRVLGVHVDFNDHVTKGQLLAEIDTSRLTAGVRRAQGELRLARAELRGAKVDAELAASVRARADKLATRGLTSGEALDSAVARARRAAATVDTARARASVAAAALAAAEDDVARARIVAPIEGIVLARNVEPGQTLASTFQVPVVFQIARDLTELRLNVRVDEADVARVRPGQQAQFTVEAHPGRQFASQVVSLRNVPTVEQGVVSYEAVLAVDNHEGLLRPGMTTTATIVTETIDETLLVPNAALRFLPLDDAKREADREESGERKPSEAKARVWTLGDEGPVALAVVTGKSDGERTEIVGGELKDGTQVLVDVEEAPR
jgi:HlyD family secretion protein